ncbi:MAG: rhomboid family intramembrane serine protease [Planctomycetales bacterium]|nr:rhomboid family intramembrane serine protease [Planctomycetales bacterium]
MGVWSHIWDGEPWRPFTTTLLHGNLIHVIFNVYWLLLLGTALERALGSLRYAGIVVLLGYIPMLLQFVVNGYWVAWTDPAGNMPMIVGLSGVVYGLFSIAWVARPYRSEFYAICNDATVRVMLGWLVVCAALTWSGVMMVANLAHIGGLGLGWLMGKSLFDRPHRTRWAVATVVVSIALLCTLIACPGHPGYEDAMRVRRNRALLRQQSRSSVGYPSASLLSSASLSPVCSAMNSRTAWAIGRIESSRPVSTSRTRGQSSDTSRVTRASPLANESAWVQRGWQSAAASQSKLVSSIRPRRR